MGIKQLHVYNDNLRKLPNKYGDVDVTVMIPVSIIKYPSRASLIKQLIFYSDIQTKNMVDRYSMYHSECKRILDIIIHLEHFKNSFILESSVTRTSLNKI